MTKRVFRSIFLASLAVLLAGFGLLAVELVLFALGLAMGAPVYVCGKDMQANTVTVGPESALFDRIVYAEDVNWIAIPELTAPLRVTARTRYHQTEQAATVYPAGEGQFRLEFDQPQRAPTPGQAVVLYQGDVVLGGGTIVAVE